MNRFTHKAVFVKAGCLIGFWLSLSGCKLPGLSATGLRDNLKLNVTSKKSLPSAPPQGEISGQQSLSETNWLEYKNKEFGFGFSYPARLTPNDSVEVGGDLLGVTTFRTDGDEVSKPAIIVGVSNFSISYISNFLSGENEHAKEMVIDGQKALKWEGRDSDGSGGERVDVYIETPAGQLISLTIRTGVFAPEAAQAVERILASFSFSEKPGI